MKKTKPITITTKINIFHLLEKTNKKFTQKLKQDQDSNKQNSYQDCAQGYQKILELIDNQGENSDLFKKYLLEAQFGKIQCNVNDLPQNPSNEAILKSNDKKIDMLTKSLTDLNAQVDALTLHEKALSPSLSQDYDDLLNKIEKYSNAWSATISQRKAVYYYNFAETLIEKATSKNSNESEINCAINYFFLSGTLYEAAGMTEDADKTITRQNEVEEQLKQLKESRKKISTNKPEVSPALANSSKETGNLYSISLKNQTALSNNNTLTAVSTLPPKKRKNWEIFNAEEPVSKKPFTDEINKKQPKETKSEATNFVSSTLIDKIKNKIQESEKYQKKLIFTGEIGKNPNHRTVKPWRGTSVNSLRKKYASNAGGSLSHNKKKSWRSTTINISPEKLNALHHQVMARYASVNPPKKYTSNIKESLSHEKKSWNGTTTKTIKHSDSFSFSFEDTLKEIENTIQSAYKPNENLFYAKLFRELVKFHTYPKNRSWQENTFSPQEEISLNKECLRLLTISERLAEESSNGQQELKDKIQKLKKHLLQSSPKQSLTLAKHHPVSSFFQSPKQQIEPLSTLREHIQCLVKCRIAYTKPEIIYKPLLKFIKTYCTEQNKAEILDQSGTRTPSIY